MKTFLSGLFFLSATLIVNAQKSSPGFKNPIPASPRLVVGIVVDQMRWDYLYRYYSRFKPNGGFRRMMSKGFSCDNTYIPYTPTWTACGHTCIYTGSVPALHGITGNNWIDRVTGKNVYCSEDSSVNTIGGPPGINGQQSPRNMLSSAVTDELRIATNFRSKVIGIAIKDRGSIFPAGHSANAAYWYDNRTGNWITSSYYGLPQLPAWVQAVNEKKLPDAYYEKGWTTLYPVNTYVQSTTDNKAYEGQRLGKDNATFPYDLKLYKGRDYTILPYLPQGNSYTFELAKAAIQGESLGKDSITDVLAVSFSATDNAGHHFGPNSVEIEDMYLRLDIELGEFFDYLDKHVGAGQYLAFLSADHAVANTAGFMMENRLPGKPFDIGRAINAMAPRLKNQFGSDRLITSTINHQVHIDHRLVDSLKINTGELKAWINKELERLDFVARAFDIRNVLSEPVPKKLREMVANGYYPLRSGDIQFVPKPHYVAGGNAGTTHGLWNPYDSHIPLLWYGWRIKPGKSNREIYMTDIAPTIAALLKIQEPGASIGTVIREITE